MSLFQNIRLGLVHVGVAITFVPITGVLNRVMIHEMEMLASLVAGMMILPYLFSPLQLYIGQYSDRHPIFGYRRTPYILLGVLLCLGGAQLTPYAALALNENFWSGFFFSILAFGCWGIGYNLSAVSYLSLASDMSGPKERSRVISVMWFMMIAGIVINATSIGRALDPYSTEKLLTMFKYDGLASAILVTLGLTKLESRLSKTSMHSDDRASHGAVFTAIAGNPRARIFFIYLIILLASILGQDVLLEPYAAHAFGMTVKQTTQLTAIWGTSTMVALLLHGFILNRWLSTKQGATAGSVVAAIGLALIGASGLLGIKPVFIPGIVLLGLGTGMATSTNLALMLGMTAPEQTGLFIGAWGVADALSRVVGNFLGGFGRDVIAHLSESTLVGYVSVFFVEAALLLVSIAILRHINAETLNEERRSVTDVIAIAGDAS